MTRMVFVLLAVAGLASPALAGGDTYGDRAEWREAADAPPPPHDRGPPMGIYDRIEAHYGPMGRDVREEYRDGPCRIERHWEKDGDFEEHIKCRGPRR